MSKILEEIPQEPITVRKAQDLTIRKRIFARGSIYVTENANAAATSIDIRRDHPAFAEGDMLAIPGTDIVITVDTGGCAAGAITMPVEALPAPLRKGDELQLLADLTDADERLEVLRGAEDATAVIAITGTVVTPQSSAANRGFVDFALTAATHTADKDVGVYYYAVWRRNSGANRPQVEGRFTIEAAGFL